MPTPKRKPDKPIESPDELADFLRGCERVECVRIEARHLVAGQEAMSVVATWELGDAEDETGGEHFNAEEIYGKLISDAESWGAVQRYVLLAFREGSKTPRERFPLLLDGGADGNASLSEPANAAGLLAQTHRHLEATQRMHLAGFQQTITALTSENKRQAELIEKLMSERTEVFDLLGQIQKQDRDKFQLEQEAKRRDHQRDMVGEGLKLLIPGIINKIAPSNEAKETAVTALVESLDDSQREVIFSALKPQQQAALGSILEKAIAKAPKKEEAVS